MGGGRRSGGGKEIAHDGGLETDAKEEEEEVEWSESRQARAAMALWAAAENT